MAGDRKNPDVGEWDWDGTEFEEYAVDVPPGGLQGLLATREGFLAVCLELLSNQVQWGKLAGITDQEMTDLATTNARIARIDVFLPVLIKAVEMLTETRYVLDDHRQRIALDAAKSIDRRAKRQPSLLAKYQLTRTYRSAVAKKALKTRRKNAEEATESENPAQPDAPATA